ncbi:MAG: radical SAM protein [Ignisphaera sp.]|uniref:Radical SAM protein n=1 Tax=Ignisphaera aggregans TaxID=334771 RepID=A0A7J3I908_9CREN
MGRILSLVEHRERVRRELEGSLSTDVIGRARRDFHSFRAPRPCGMTIHTGVGCSNRCAYCYIYDMGFPGSVEVYPLPAEGIVYALSLNPYIAPTATLAAYGSVTEPFNPVTRDFSLKLMELVYRYLKLPSQVSTKSILDGDVVSRIIDADARCSVLVTVVAIDRAKILEPYAPDPVDRITYAGHASRYLHTSLFIRPVIPGVTDAEIDRILKLAVEYGIRRIVIGALRVTEGILTRIRNIDHLLYREIVSRLPREPRGREQIAIRVDDVKKVIVRKAREHQVKVYTSACQANIDAHGEFCNMCSRGPCGNIHRIEAIDESDIAEFLEYMGTRPREITVSRNCIAIEVESRIRREKLDHIKRFLEQVLRTVVKIRSI